MPARGACAVAGPLRAIRRALRLPACVSRTFPSRLWTVSGTAAVLDRGPPGEWLCRHRLYRTRRGLWRLFGERVARLMPVGAPGRGRRKPGLFRLAESHPRVRAWADGRVSPPRHPHARERLFLDHPFFHQRARPERLTCWSPMMKENLVATGFRAGRSTSLVRRRSTRTSIRMASGAARSCATAWSRSARPILLFATLGQLRSTGRDGTFRAFMAALDQASLAGATDCPAAPPTLGGLLLREFRSRRDVVFSRYVRSCPACGGGRPAKRSFSPATAPPRDVCISPGSTMAWRPRSSTRRRRAGVQPGDSGGVREVLPFELAEPAPSVRKFRKARCRWPAHPINWCRLFEKLSLIGRGWPRRKAIGRTCWALDGRSTERLAAL